MPEFRQHEWAREWAQRLNFTRHVWFQYVSIIPKRVVVNGLTTVSIILRRWIKTIILGSILIQPPKTWPSIGSHTNGFQDQGNDIVRLFRLYSHHIIFPFFPHHIRFYNLSWSAKSYAICHVVFNTAMGHCQLKKEVCLLTVVILHSQITKGMGYTSRLPKTWVSRNGGYT